MKDTTNERRPSAVPETAMQDGEIRPAWAGWAERSVWTERMLTALEQGVKGGCWFSLMDKVYAERNLRGAAARVAANGGAAGVDHVSVKRFGRDLEANVARLSAELRAGEYRPRPVRRVHIPKPGSRETRPLGIPTVRDRVVQGAVRHAMEPIFEREFAGHSYGFRPGRGCKDALRRVDELLKGGHVYVVDIDLKSYFDTIPHGPLMDRVRERIADGPVLRLVESFLKAGIMDGLREWTPDAGAPQGAVLSPLLANIYLHELDKHWREKRLEERLNARLVRYADDFVVVCRGRAEAAMREVREVLTGLSLSLNEAKTRRVEAWKESFVFLGFDIRMRRSPRTGRAFAMVRPSGKAMKRIRQVIKERTTRAHLARSEAEVIADLNRRVRGWVQYFHYRNSTRDFNKLRRILADRVRIYLSRRRRNRTLWGYQTYPDRVLHGRYGLYRIPVTAPWKPVPAHAVR